ncbi:unnamed protein product [Bemisia tabaci]|uniref:valine--tRNA ligase n=1 Tax=Bemisia tabaci TaxID=7038 RepID=A0A9P0AB34_BEMTA|nr:unnamed protein product [Bemisia tabaci]
MAFSIFKALNVTRCSFLSKKSLIYSIGWHGPHTFYFVYAVRATHTAKEFPLSYSPQVVEKGRYKKWEESGDFKLKTGGSDLEVFCMILPPPNVTGTLHLGHAYTVTLQDILCRWKRMQGHPVVWVPGFDHAGIATQIVVEKKLKKERNVSRHELGREKFIQEVMSWKEEKIPVIKTQLKKLGASLDWSREKFTMDEGQSIAVQEALIRLFEAGWLYRDEMLVNWCCHLQSAISDAEVEHKEVEGPTEFVVPGYAEPVTFGLLHYFSYEVVSEMRKIDVATTRLETMLGDVAVAVNPNDERYKNLKGAFLKHPLRLCHIPLIYDDSVDPNFGTGAVKITPAHSHADLEVAKRHNLPIVPVITEDGRIHESLKDSGFAGMKRYDARRKLISYLIQKRLYVEEKPHSMAVPICCRSGDIIEFLMKPQWFLKLDIVADRIVKSLNENEVDIEPSSGKKALIDWFTCNKRPWCISRQMWWGHRLPLYSAKNTWVAAHSMEEATKKIKEKLNLSDGEMKNLVITQDEDVLDTWFSSGLLPFSVFGWPKITEDLERFYPLSLMETGNDIIGFWVARMLTLGLFAMDKLPFKKVILHGLITDPQGRKMSKSRGNVIDPLHIIHGISSEQLQEELKKSYQSGHLSDKEFDIALAGQKRLLPVGIMECGADALRLTLSSHDFRNSFIKFDWQECEKNRRFCNKIVQACKFCRRWVNKAHASSTDQPEVSSSYPEAWILSRLADCVSRVNSGLDSYNFHHAANAILHFFVFEFCDIFLEAVKPVLYDSFAPVIDWNEEDTATLPVSRTMLLCLETYLRLLAPFMPFLSEELYFILTGKKVHNAPFPTQDQYVQFRNSNLDADFRYIMNIVKAMRRSTVCHSKYFPDKDYRFSIRTNNADMLTNHIDMIKTLGKCISVNLEKETPTSPYFLDTPVDDNTSIHLLINLQDFDLLAYERQVTAKHDSLQKKLKSWTRGHPQEKYQNAQPKKVKLHHEKEIEKGKEELSMISDYLEILKVWIAQTRNSNHED